ncbi:MAG: endonuclease/exonuclease/phosphatase family protein [Mameliella sp.]|nr:endonuclease/exonuclease/phosphatase family protein [Phaeodactylibacter sp.]
MLRPAVFLFLVAVSIVGGAQNPPIQLKVMAWNILHGGNDLEEGPAKVIEIIDEIDPNIVLMVETYGSGPKIANALGCHFHLIAAEDTALDDESVNLSIFSKYPFGERIDNSFPFYLGGRSVRIGRHDIRVFSNWFHYLPWLDAPEKAGWNAEELLTWEKNGKRYKMLQKVLPYFKHYAAEADSIPMIVGGDMNTPSHLDWGPETQHLHNDLVVPWETTRSLERVGLMDAFRVVHPNPVAHSGITWDTPNAVDEHRIDYVFYKGLDLEPVSAQTYFAHFGESLFLNGKRLPFPSDHGIVVTTFQLNP